jgi:hypothetical protein
MSAVAPPAEQPIGRMARVDTDDEDADAARRRWAPRTPLAPMDQWVAEIHEKYATRVRPGDPPTAHPPVRYTLGRYTYWSHSAYEVAQWLAGIGTRLVLYRRGHFVFMGDVRVRRSGGWQRQGYACVRTGDTWRAGWWEKGVLVRCLPTPLNFDAWVSPFIT